MPRNCKEKNKDGTPCHATPLSDQDYCFFHSPSKDRDRKAAKSKAGKVTALRFQGLEHLPADGPDFKLETPADAKALLEKIVNLTLKGTLAHQISNSIGQLILTFMRAHEVSEVEARLLAIEGRLKDG